MSSGRPIWASNNDYDLLQAVREEGGFKSLSETLRFVLDSFIECEDFDDED